MSSTTLAGIGLAVVAVGHAIGNFATGGLAGLTAGLMPDLLGVLAAFGLYKAADATTK